MITIDLAGKVAFVTGSTRGIGRAIAGKLHAAGARVAIVGREESNASAVAAEMGEGTVGIAIQVFEPGQRSVHLGFTEAGLEKLLPQDPVVGCLIVPLLRERLKQIHEHVENAVIHYL